MKMNEPSPPSRRSLSLIFLSSQETFLAFRSHDISFPEDDERAAYDLQRDWESLYLGALYRASTLESTSDRFSGMTQDQIYDFVKELEEFAKNFEAYGPGSVGDDLELGLVKMEVSESFSSFNLTLLIVEIDER